MLFCFNKILVRLHWSLFVLMLIANILVKHFLLLLFYISLLLPFFISLLYIISSNFDKPLYLSYSIFPLKSYTISWKSCWVIHYEMNMSYIHILIEVINLSSIQRAKRQYFSKFCWPWSTRNLGISKRVCKNIFKHFLMNLVIY